MAKHFLLSVVDNKICDLLNFLVEEKDLPNILSNMDKERYEVAGDIKSIGILEDDIKKLFKKQDGLETGGK